MVGSLAEPLLAPTNIEDDDKLFYENIEAPKFVDLAAPDMRCSDDDRFWFCLRVGCDRKHDEEMNPEAIYKSFLLRVMAARSPNIRLKKKDPGLSSRCPKSVPPKSRVTRLGFISSISKKLVDSETKSKPLSSCLKSTPGRQVSKPQTTPRSKGKDSQPARCLMKVLNEATSNECVAKALSLTSPSKVMKVEPSLVKNSSVKKGHIGRANKASLRTMKPTTSESKKVFACSEKKKEEAIDGAENDKENAVSANDQNRFNNSSVKAQVKFETKRKQKENSASEFKNSSMKAQPKLKQNQKVIKVSGISSEASKRQLNPTILKPFRLRTDERGILKESNMENRVNQTGTSGGQNGKLHTPLKEMSKVQGGKETANLCRHTVSSRQKLAGKAIQNG